MNRLCLVLLCFHQSLAEISVQHGADNGNIRDQELPLGLEKKSRLFTFNNEDGEIKIELDFSVPFLQIPIGGKRSGDGHPYPLVGINTRGLVTTTAMMFFLIAVIPKILKIFIPQVHASALDRFAPLMSRLDEAIRHPDFPSSECYQRIACWTAGSPVSPEFVKNFSKQWLGTSPMVSSMNEAFSKGRAGSDCNYYECSWSSIAAMFKFFTNANNVSNG